MISSRYPNLLTRLKFRLIYIFFNLYLIILRNRMSESRFFSSYLEIDVGVRETYKKSSHNCVTVRKKVK